MSKSSVSAPNQTEIFFFLKKRKVSGQIVTLQAQSQFLADKWPSLVAGTAVELKGTNVANYFGITESQSQSLKDKWSEFNLISKSSRTKIKNAPVYITGTAFVSKTASPVETQEDKDFGRLVGAFESLVSFYKEFKVAARRA